MYYCLQPAKLISQYNQTPPTTGTSVWAAFQVETKEIERHSLAHTHCRIYIDTCETAYICSFSAHKLLDRYVQILGNK